jgi:hypothetical protein
MQKIDRSKVVFKYYSPNQILLLPPNNDVEAFVKYQYFHKEQSKKWRTDPYRTENLLYDEKNDIYTCPMGQQMNFIKEKIKITNISQRINTQQKADNPFKYGSVVDGPYFTDPEDEIVRIALLHFGRQATPKSLNMPSLFCCRVLN